MLDLLSMSPEVQSLIFAADGANTSAWVRRVGQALLAIILVGGGLVLIGGGIIHLVKALRGENKDWGGAGLAIFTAIIGGLLLVAGVAFVLNLFQNLGQDFNIS